MKRSTEAQCRALVNQDGETANLGELAEAGKPNWNEAIEELQKIARPTRSRIGQVHTKWPGRS